MIKMLVTLVLCLAVLANTVVGGVAVLPGLLGLEGRVADAGYGDNLLFGILSLTVAALCFVNVGAMLAQRTRRLPIISSIGNTLLFVFAVFAWVSAWPYGFWPSAEVTVLAIVAIVSCGTIWMKYLIRRTLTPGADRDESRPSVR